MKTYSIFLALFTLMSGITYDVDEYRCKDNILQIAYENKWIEIKLFNIVIEDSVDICTYIKDDIKIELEENIQSQKNEVYVFVNGTLLQSKLIEDNKAKVKLKSPAFKYDFDKKEEMVMSVVEEKENDTFSKSRRIAYLCIAFWCISFGFVIRKLMRKRI